MNPAVILVNVLALASLVAAFLRDREKGARTVRVALRSLVGILPAVVAVMILVGLVSAFVTPKAISGMLHGRTELTGIVLVGALGSVLHIPSLVSFPLAASLIERGAPMSVAAAFITTLTMVGVVTLPLEIRELGGRVAALRNTMSFLAAIVVALIMGVLL